MPRVLKNTLIQGQYNFRYIIIFSLLFIFLGSFVPATYFKYFDNTQYIDIRQPLAVDKEVYKPCEDVKVTFARKSLVDVKANVTWNLKRVEKINEDVVYINTEGGVLREIAIEQSNDYVIRGGILTLPCNTLEGTYLYVLTIEYYPRGELKNLTLTTETFSVVK